MWTVLLITDVLITLHLSDAEHTFLYYKVGAVILIVLMTTEPAVLYRGHSYRKNTQVPIICTPVYQSRIITDLQKVSVATQSSLSLTSTCCLPGKVAHLFLGKMAILVLRNTKYEST